ncbi:hypothetical protein NIES2101_28855 [Calothrix sp. HK-06]|nr:hypothetical protein NIES2101_28855 [Calothrix sp. HK-06]
MLAKQTNSAVNYKQYKVISLDTNDATYFLEYVQDAATRKLEYCWCRADRVLNLRTQVFGYLHPAKDKRELPTLMVGHSNAIVPTAKRITLVSRSVSNS